MFKVRGRGGCSIGCDVFMVRGREGCFIGCDVFMVRGKGAPLGVMCSW